jgi:hypothetical protein
LPQDQIFRLQLCSRPKERSQTLVVLEAAFDEAWLTLKAIGNDTVRPDELARCVLRVAMEGERDPGRLHDEALSVGARSRDPLAGGRLSTVATAGSEAGPPSL